MAFGSILLRSPYTPYCIYLRGTTALRYPEDAWGFAGDSGTPLEVAQEYLGETARLRRRPRPCGPIAMPILVAFVLAAFRDPEFSI